MRLLLCATLAALALTPSLSYANDDCQAAQVEMAKAVGVMQILAAKSIPLDDETARRYEKASNMYFFCQKSQIWTFAAAPRRSTQVVAQTQGHAPPLK
jgi:hypothetical protein